MRLFSIIRRFPVIVVVLIRPDLVSEGIQLRIGEINLLHTFSAL